MTDDGRQGLVCPSFSVPRLSSAFGCRRSKLENFETFGNGHWSN
jgi:hypothetical protein